MRKLNCNHNSHYCQWEQTLMKRHCRLNSSRFILITVDQPCNKKVSFLPQWLLLPADGFGPTPKVSKSLQNFRHSEAKQHLPNYYTFILCDPQRAWGLISTLFAQFQVGFYKGLFCCLIDTNKIPRIKAMPIILFVNALIFLLYHHSQFPSDSLVSAHTSSCACIGGVEVIPHARAALGKENTPTNTSALELFVWYSTLALLWLAATAPVYRKNTTIH